MALQHGQRLRRFLSRRLPNRADAPDLAQEIYLRLLRLGRHEEIRTPEAYLLTIAGHLLHEHAMRRAAAPPSVDVGELIAPHGMVDDDLCEQAQTQQRLRALGHALARLSPKSQAVLVLHRRDGYSLEEIATELGISRNTVKKHLAKALSHCRQRLERLR
jgi:RNA polymerase sigma factor (sigma-70 family)